MGYNNKFNQNNLDKIEEEKSETRDFMSESRTAKTPTLGARTFVNQTFEPVEVKAKPALRPMDSFMPNPLAVNVDNSSRVEA